MGSRIPASERTSQKLDELLTQGVADGDARAELLKLAVRKIVEETREAEVADALAPRGLYPETKMEMRDISARQENRRLSLPRAASRASKAKLWIRPGYIRLALVGLQGHGEL